MITVYVVSSVSYTIFGLEMANRSLRSNTTLKRIRIRYVKDILLLVIQSVLHARNIIDSTINLVAIAKVRSIMKYTRAT